MRKAERLTNDEILRDGSVFPLSCIARTAEERFHVVGRRGLTVNGVVGDSRRARHGGQKLLLSFYMEIKGAFRDLSWFAIEFEMGVVVGEVCASSIQ